jgi:DNA polymerase-3 subunit chi
VPPDLTAYRRGVYLFDGHDADALAQARERWKAEKAAGHDVTYWQQAASGRWEKRA